MWGCTLGVLPPLWLMRSIQGRCSAAESQSIPEAFQRGHATIQHNNVRLPNLHKETRGREQSAAGARALLGPSIIYSNHLLHSPAHTRTNDFMRGFLFNGTRWQRDKMEPREEPKHSVWLRKALWCLVLTHCSVLCSFCDCLSLKFSRKIK